MTVAAPGVSLMASYTSGVNGWNLAPNTTKSAPMVSSMTEATDAFVEAAMTPIAVISASPMASALAVAAVRRGLRRPFSRASLPDGVAGEGRPQHEEHAAARPWGRGR